MLNELRSIVAFGGGTGLGRLLSALAPVGDRLTGIVATTDDGGSTGRLRSATGCIAWGDLRHCFNQICTESTLARLLFEYRFVDSGDLTGHNLGNLMLLALDQLTARPQDAVDLIRDFLEVEPHLLAMSEQPAALEAEGPAGERATGETTVAGAGWLPKRLWLSPEVPATPGVIEVISGADLILMGPGSFITSVLPALLLEPIREAVRRSRCPRVLIANMAPEPGPVGQLTLCEQLGWMEGVLGGRLIDAVLWPASRPLAERPPLPVHIVDVADSSRLHHREKLATALAAMLPNLFRRD
jgi:uncharacterized cofD-like protein